MSIYMRVCVCNTRHISIKPPHPSSHIHSLHLFLFRSFNPISSIFLKRMSSRPGDWNCRACHHLNFQRRDSCQLCGEPRFGSDYGGFGGGRGGTSFGITTGPDVRPGDWYCNIGNCGTHNFASRSTCFKCGAFKDDISPGFDGETTRPRGFAFGGSGGGGGSRSGWKSGDWICTMMGCNEHNFASRMECFRCNAPRDSGAKSSYF